MMGEWTDWVLWMGWNGVLLDGLWMQWKSSGYGGDGGDVWVFVVVVWWV